jgi:predicted membrane protein
LEYYKNYEWGDKIMYDENTFKNYIFWLKVKRVFFMLAFSIIGAIIGIAISELIVNILTFSTSLRYIIIAASTLLFFAISLLVTAGTGKEVQEGYWKIAVLRKLTVISKKLDNIQIISTENVTTNSERLSSSIQKEIVKSLKEDKKDLEKKHSREKVSEEKQSTLDKIIEKDLKEEDSKETLKEESDEKNEENI